MNFRSIEIDLEVHKFLENNRRNFSETECDILRRVFLEKEKYASPLSGSDLSARNTSLSAVFSNLDAG